MYLGYAMDILAILGCWFNILVQLLTISKVFWGDM